VYRKQEDRCKNTHYFVELGVVETDGLGDGLGDMNVSQYKSVDGHMF
jgi:hypothetical protein